MHGAGWSMTNEPGTEKNGKVALPVIPSSH
jgi:hypothetical protein